MCKLFAISIIFRALLTGDLLKNGDYEAKAKMIYGLSKPYFKTS